MIDINFCMSSYLAFRYVANPVYSWKSGISPKFPEVTSGDQVPIKNKEDIANFLFDYIKEHVDSSTGILLSGGIDSAILASFLPEGTKAYTIRFIADGAIDESTAASLYATAYKLDHRIIDVHWSDYQEYTPLLMANKKSPLHAVEVGLYKAALAARKDNVNKLLIGNGADSTFGGMDKLLSRDWTFNEFMQRYTFVLPETVLKHPVSMKQIYSPFKTGEAIDYISFLKTVHGIGIIQAFDNALSSAGCNSLEPYECMKLAFSLDLAKIRSGSSKYMLREVFLERYLNLDVPEKIPFARPMDVWLKDWRGTIRPEFANFNIDHLTGDQKWLVYCLEKFLNQIV
ncbi:asparagine synthase C-terminal domain-containing protein [Sporomusa sphaeroides]|uniref:asparagine synthase C-terminal domain-containing protein n=1 Tax=Sporomusa sphaeroides TaxID=47679 RepID=UPI002BAFD553|nr:asparagine synthase C-terminal domain-containing protein [Sporomusa sphaeroides]HML34228.1 asparagine synthase C-terminal domain-containing protein [Sporomusa sphaeroides]